jgi:hypothetical protein
MSWRWSKVEKTRLAAMVSRDATSWLTDPRLPVNWNDLHGSPDARRALIQTLYETLVCYEINYVPNKYSGRDETQLMRTPQEILDSPREGTCLDLSLLFCGLCLGCELLPWLMMMRGHAFVLVSLEHRLPKFEDRSRPEWKWFLDGPLIDAARPREVLAKGKYLAVECTGFARSGALPKEFPEGRGRANGTLPFKAAVDAGQAQLDYAARPFDYAIDMAVALFSWGIEPDSLPQPRRASGTARPSRTASEREPGVLPLLVDRVEQSQSVRDIILPDEGRRGRPAVTFLAGDLGQAHGDLVRRLRLYDLPDWLRLRVEEGDVEEFPVQLPQPGSQHFDRRLLLELQSALRLLPDRPHWGDVSRWFSERTVPAVLSTTFNTDAWEQDGSARVEALLRSWEACPDVPAGHEPLVFLKWVYQPRRTSTVARWLGRDSNARMAAFRARLGDRFRAGKDFPGIRGECPLQLADVGAGHLVEWCDLKPVREFIGDRGGMEQEMEKVFLEAASKEHRDGLPMGRVIPCLDRWLRRCAQGA